MKSLLIFLFLVSSVVAGETPHVIPRGTITIKKNVFGGYTYYSRGGVVGRSTQNSFNGLTTYSRSGYIGRSEKTYSGYRIRINNAKK